MAEYNVVKKNLFQFWFTIFRTNSYPCPKKSSLFNMVLDFETREGEKFKTCDYQYLCNQKSDKCILFNAPMGLGFYEYINGYTQGKAYDIYGNKKDKIILVGCSTKRFKNDLCETDTCKDNKDCFSDNCVNGVCMTNEKIL